MPRNACMPACLIASALLIGTASAQVNLVGIIDDSRTLSVSTYLTETKDGVVIMALASDAANIKTVTLRGDNKNMVICKTAVCNYLWTKADMVTRKCTNCTLSVIATDLVGKTYTIDTKIARPQ